jgi:hypothetical protein
LLLASEPWGMTDVHEAFPERQHIEDDDLRAGVAGA